MTATTGITLGGLLTALLVLIANLRPWYVGGREMKKLAPFSKGFAAAVCAAACPGGILGWAHTHTGGVANTVGEKTGAAATGTAPAAALSRGQLVGLGMTGACIVALAVFLVYLAWKAAGKEDKRRIFGGAYVGTVFVGTAGVAGALSWVPGALNAAGQSVVDAFNGTGIL
ncbi:hypothetical protein [Streptomyces sp. NPDC057413]|uniref:hypothetical protein n=1 Tax=Streptomyces sp. NPDC057413 TaxID=3346124 RepID=UPI003683EAFF